MIDTLYQAGLNLLPSAWWQGAAWPVLWALLGIAAGHWLHDRVDETRFRTFVWSCLVAASGLLLAG